MPALICASTILEGLAQGWICCSDQPAEWEEGMEGGSLGQVRDGSE